MDKRCVVLYGSEAALLDTRGLILERAGYKAYVGDEFGRLQEIIITKNIELCILCQSLTPEQCDRVISFGSRIRPHMRILSLSATNVAAAAQKIDVLDTFVGPLLLIETVEQMIGPAKTSAGTAQLAKTPQK